MTIGDIMEHLPQILRRDGLMEKFVEAHEEEFDDINVRREEIPDSIYVDNASGKDLNRIGAIFGELGKRRGRSDSDYRVYLKGIVDSFNGRGTVDGLKFAISSATGISEDDVIIEEDFEELSYTIQVTNVDSSFISSSINDLAELADPSVVELAEAIIVVDGDTLFILTANESSVISERTGLGGGTLSLNGNDQLGVRPPSIKYREATIHGRHRFGQALYGENLPYTRDKVTPSGVTDTVGTPETLLVDTYTIDGEVVVRGDLFVNSISGDGEITGEETSAIGEV